MNESVLDGPWPPRSLVFLSFIVQWEPKTHAPHSPQSWRPPPPGHLAPPLVPTCRAILTQLSLVRRRPHPEVCARYVFFTELAAACPCRSESSQGARVDVCWGSCFLIALAWCFVNARGLHRGHTEATQAPHRRHTGTVPSPFMISFFSALLFRP